MPSVRPAKAKYYLARDEQYYRTLRKLLSGLVIHIPNNLNDQVSLDQIAEMVATSSKVTTEQLLLALLSHDKFLVVLPPTVSREEVVASLPPKLWDDGFRFQSYSPLSDSSVSILFFKIWIDIKGVPLELYTEAHMATAISSFGTYLGSMEPALLGDCLTWTVFLATDDLALVPYEIEMRVGGMVSTARIYPRKWTKGQVFHRSELPPASVSYQSLALVPKPPQNPSSHPSVDQMWLENDDVVPMSLNALREIFRHVPPSELPTDMAACLAGDERAIATNQAAYRKWERDSERWRKEQSSHAPLPTEPTVTQDPPQ